MLCSNCTWRLIVSSHRCRIACKTLERGGLGGGRIGAIIVSVSSMDLFHGLVLQKAKNCLLQ